MKYVYFLIISLLCFNYNAQECRILDDVKAQYNQMFEVETGDIIFVKEEGINKITYKAPVKTYHFVRKATKGEIKRGNSRDGKVRDNWIGKLVYSDANYLFEVTKRFKGDYTLKSDTLPSGLEQSDVKLFSTFIGKEILLDSVVGNCLLFTGNGKKYVFYHLQDISDYDLFKKFKFNPDKLLAINNRIKELVGKKVGIVVDRNYRYIQNGKTKYFEKAKKSVFIISDAFIKGDDIYIKTNNGSEIFFGYDINIEFYDFNCYNKEILAKGFAKLEKDLAAKKIKQEEFYAAIKKCNYKTNEIDPIDNVTSKRTHSYYGTTIDGKYLSGSVRIEFGRYGSRKYIVFYSCGIECVNGESEIQIKLTNGTIVKMYHNGDIDCDNCPGLITYPSSSQWNTLKKNSVEMIRVIGSRYKSDHKEFYDVNIFKNQCQCVE